jgi:hypothetical protein
VNPFIEHHQRSIRFQYSCFDRMLLNAVAQPMQQPAMIVGFLDKCRQVPSITKAYFRGVSEDYHRFVAQLSAEQRIPARTSSVRSSATASPRPIGVGSRLRLPTIIWAIRSSAASTRTAPSNNTCVTTACVILSEFCRTSWAILT